MKIKEWIMKNIENFNDSIKNEEDVKIKLILPYLEFLGYKKDEMFFNNSIDVVIGCKKKTIFSDIEIKINNHTELVIDTKNPANSITQKDTLQSVSYAKLINIQPAVFGITTNGLQTSCVNIYTGLTTNDIPSREELIRSIDKSKPKFFKDVEIKELKSVLYTITSQDEMFKVIKECKEIIEKRGLIRSDQSFREMTKILLVKMNEERRVLSNGESNRFCIEYLESVSKINKISFLDVFINLFNEAKFKFPNIYNKDDELLKINDNLCLKSIVEKLEPFSFVGTGDDIKGAVYEIFLKATLRGDFDQYFTPREIVDFMVRFSDPDIGDIILDPACGSGGFLIYAFNYINAKIHSSNFSEVERNTKFKDLINKCLCGGEADYDLHVLAKINLIMHGDGWNNIIQGDSLRTTYFKENSVDLILENPPFTIPYTFSDVLGSLELGQGKESEELDILFVEKSLYFLKPGHDMYIILPEGLLNTKRYHYFRKWLLKKSYIILSISLPEGAFIPFGSSVSKTCILGLRKKGEMVSKPNYIFIGCANEIGYEKGKKDYKAISKNCLNEFIENSNHIFKDIRVTRNEGEYGWIDLKDITDYRIDARYLLNKISKYEGEANICVPLKELCNVEGKSIRIDKNKLYYYLEIPDISEETGIISNIRKIIGSSLTSDSYNIFYPGDIIFSRINPRISRVSIIPEIKEFGITSKEIYRITYKDNNYIPKSNFYCIVSLLRSVYVKNQIKRLATGSSSSRARVQLDEFKEILIPILPFSKQQQLSNLCLSMSNNMWNSSQQFINDYIETLNIIGEEYDKNSLRKI